MTSAPQKKYWTFEEYLEFDRNSDEKWEYLDGEVFQVFAMAGASPDHSLITSNVNRAFGNLLEGKNCRVYSSDLRGKRGLYKYAYSDVTIVCGKSEFDDITLLNPILIVEVLSPATEKYDRGDKAQQYRRLASLQAYLLIAQDRVSIELHERQANGQWLITDAIELDTHLEVTLPCLKAGASERRLRLPSPYGVGRGATLSFTDASHPFCIKARL